MNTATAKQINFAMSLLARNGFSTEWMDSSFKRLGATMRERSGRVEAWLTHMNRQRISRLIDELKTA